MDFMQRSKVRYSPMEEKLLQLLPKRGKRISVTDLVDQYYNHPGQRPYTARQTIISSMSALIKKVDHNQEPYMIIKERFPGQQMEYARVDR